MKLAIRHFALIVRFILMASQQVYAVKRDVNYEIQMQFSSTLRNLNSVRSVYYTQIQIDFKIQHVGEMSRII